jgi:hypothetical protein
MKSESWSLRHTAAKACVPHSTSLEDFGEEKLNNLKLGSGY